MITVRIYRNAQGDIYKFQATSHGDKIVCSAVSILTLNAVNSIEKFTGEEFTCNYEEKGGFLEVTLPAIEEGKNNKDVNLLLESMLLGLRGIEMDYSKHIKVTENFSGGEPC